MDKRAIVSFITEGVVKTQKKSTKLKFTERNYSITDRETVVKVRIK